MFSELIVLGYNMCRHTTICIVNASTYRHRRQDEASQTLAATVVLLAPGKRQYM